MKVLLILLSIFASSPAYALTCKNDYGGGNSCAANSTTAGDCQTLGFAKADVADCAHYLYCPFDLSYKRCVSSTSSCPSGWTLNLTSTANCSSDGSGGWTIESVKFTDSLSCGKCICQSESTCTWMASSAGANGALSNKCCNGNYKTCTNNCKDTVSVPANATAVKTSCTACGTTKQITSDFTCNSGYSKSGSSCVASACPSGYLTTYQSIQDCKAGGNAPEEGNGNSKYWTFSTNGVSGTKVCGKCTRKCTEEYNIPSPGSLTACGGVNDFGASVADTDPAGCRRCIHYLCDFYEDEKNTGKVSCEKKYGEGLCISFNPLANTTPPTPTFVAKPICWKEMRVVPPTKPCCSDVPEGQLVDCASC